jgi:hypothetical protein
MYSYAIIQTSREVIAKGGYLLIHGVLKFQPTGECNGKDETTFNSDRRGNGGWRFA